jgi:hypothetical protein
MAVAVGFEPTEDVNPHALSRSASGSSAQIAWYVSAGHRSGSVLGERSRSSATETPNETLSGGSAAAVSHPTATDAAPTREHFLIVALLAAASSALRPTFWPARLLHRLTPPAPDGTTGCNQRHRPIRGSCVVAPCCGHDIDVDTEPAAPRAVCPGSIPIRSRPFPSSPSS